MASIIVQEINIWWGKKSRGGEAAMRRNAIPEAFPIPYFPSIPDTFSLVHDKVTFSDGLTHNLAIHEITPRARLHIGCIYITWDKTSVSATFARNPGCAGAPIGIPYPRKVLNLTLGMWGQIRYNGRFGGYSGWGYKKTVINIGYVENLSEDIFLTDPHRVFSDMADLW